MPIRRWWPGAVIAGMIFAGCHEEPLPEPAADARPHRMAEVHEENELRASVFEAALKQLVPKHEASLFLRYKPAVSVCAIVVSHEEDPLQPAELRAVHFTEPERRAVLAAEPLGLVLAKIAEERGLVYSCPASGKQEQHTDVFIGAAWLWPGDREVEVRMQRLARPGHGLYGWSPPWPVGEALVCGAEPVGRRWVTRRCENEYSVCRRTRACS